MSRRSKAREIVLQMLYQLDMNPDVPGPTVLEQVQERLTGESSTKFAWSLYVGVLECKAELDAKLEAIAANWSVRRMAPTDRNVLRLGAFELLYTETPPRVVIDEALELAKKFGSSQSAQFVNGILDRLIPPGRDDRQQRGTAPPPDPELDADLESSAGTDPQVDPWEVEFLADDEARRKRELEQQPPPPVEEQA